MSNQPDTYASKWDCRIDAYALGRTLSVASKQRGGSKHRIEDRMIILERRTHDIRIIGIGPKYVTITACTTDHTIDYPAPRIIALRADDPTLLSTAQNLTKQEPDDTCRIMKTGAPHLPGQLFTDDGIEFTFGGRSVFIPAISGVTIPPLERLDMLGATHNEAFNGTVDAEWVEACAKIKADGYMHSAGSSTQNLFLFSFGRIYERPMERTGKLPFLDDLIPEYAGPEDSGMEAMNLELQGISETSGPFDEDDDDGFDIELPEPLLPGDDDDETDTGDDTGD